MRSLELYGIQGKMTRRLSGVVIGTQGVAVFFGALVTRALASTERSHASSTFLLIGALAVLCVLDAGLMRRPWGITLGWAVQLATLACALLLPAMLIVGLLFGALWVTALVQGRKMDEHTQHVDARWHAAQEESAQQASAGEPTAQTTAEERSANQRPSQDG
jgi:hypothetical protein